MRTELFGVVEVLLVTAVSVVFHLPFPLEHLRPGLDPSMQFALGELFAAGADFGRDVIHQYGPYGFLRNRMYNAATQDVRIWGQMFFALTLSLGLLDLARRGFRSVLARGFWVLLLLVVLSGKDTEFMVLPVVLWLCVAKPRYGPRKVDVVTVLLVSALALATLIKFTYFLAATTGLAVVSLFLLSERRPASSDLALTVLALYATSLCAFWLLADQPLTSLPAYFTERVHLAAGYSESHAISGPSWQPLTFGCLALLGLILVASSDVRGAFERSPRRSGICTWLVVAALSFLTFKHAFVRHDIHALHAVFFAFAIGILLGPFLRRPVPASRPGPGWPCGGAQRTVRAPRVRLALAWCVGGSVLLWCAGLHLDVTGEHLHRRLLGSVNERARAVRGAIAARTDPYAAENDRLRALDLARTLPDLEGTVDVFSDDLSLLFAHRYEGALRPTLQPYQAVDSYLSRRSAEGLSAEHLLVRMSRIDHRLLALADSLTWVEALRSYRPIASEGEVLIMRRREVPKAFHLGEVRRETVEWGETVSLDLPGRSLGWMTVRVHDSAAGLARRLIYKGGVHQIHIELRNGHVISRRFIVSAGETGFLVSPSVETTGQFAAVARGSWGRGIRRRQVRSVRFETSHPSLVDTQIEVEWRQIDFAEPAGSDSLPQELSLRSHSSRG